MSDNNIVNLKPISDILGVKFWTFKHRTPGRFMVFRIVGLVDSRYVFQNVRDSKQFIYRDKTKLMHGGDMQPALMDCEKLFGAKPNSQKKAVGE